MLWLTGCSANAFRACKMFQHLFSCVRSGGKPSHLNQWSANKRNFSWTNLDHHRTSLCINSASIFGRGNISRLGRRYGSDLVGGKPRPDVTKPNSKKTDIKRLLALASPEKYRIAGAVGLLLVSSSVTMAVPFCMGKVIDIIYSASAEGNMTDKLRDICQILVVVFLVGAAANSGRVYLMLSAGQRIIKRLREKIFSSIMRQEISFFDKSKTGELINRLSTDTSLVGQSVTMNVSDGLRSVAQAIGGISMMFYVSPKLAVFGLGVVPPVAMVAIIYGRYVRKITKKVQDSLADATEVAEERISNVRVVRAFTQEQREMDSYEAQIDQVLKYSLNEAVARGFFWGFTGLSGNLIVLTVFYKGGLMMNEAVISVGDLSAFLLYAAYVGISIGGLSSFYTELNRGMGASVRLWELADRVPAIPHTGGQMLPSEIKGSIEFRDVHFTYPTRTEAPIFSGLSLRVPPGSLTAVVGASGSGKSTIASLILRFYDPDGGEVLVDGINIKDLNSLSLRQHIGTVSQEPVLFSCTIAENIAYGALEPSKVTTAEIMEAAKKANAYSFITEFPNGFDTVVGEKGLMLSGGQRQRVAIARALLKNPKILLLDEATSCGYELSILWSTEVSRSPFAATPLITDVDGDGSPDIVAAPFTEEVQVVRAEDGQILPDSHWPFHLADRTVLASPLQYDINRDGKLDILIITTDGEFMFFTPEGQQLSNSTYKLEPLYVDKNWFEKIISIDRSEIHKYILEKQPTQEQISSYVGVDPHVLATPVIADINNDGLPDELVIPVSYYFEDEPVSVNIDDTSRNVSSLYLHNYLSSAVVVMNLTTLKPIHLFHLELTKKLAEYPGYVLFTPTVIDLDGDSGLPEIVVGTSAGKVHVFDVNGKTRQGFPRSVDTIHGQITVADVNNDGELELVVMDTSANVMCFDSRGKRLWESSVSGTSSAGSRVADMDGDGKMEVIIAADDGNVWALRGADGSVEKDWPIRVGRRLTSNVLLTRLSSNKLVLVVLADDGYLHILSESNRCRQTLGIGEMSLVQPLAYDLVSQSNGLELLVATKDGTLICLGAHLLNRELRQHHDASELILYSWPQETKGYNGFTFTDGNTGVIFTDEIRQQSDLVGGTYPVSFVIFDGTAVSSRSYRAQVFFGSNLIGNGSYESPGRYVIHVNPPRYPTEGHLSVLVRNEYGQVFTDMCGIRFNKTFLQELQWLLCVPFVAMALMLLLVHGYPTADLLPVTQRSKGR